MQNLGWSVESDVFNDRTPNFDTLQFENIIAKLNPNAKRYLALACHYDSKYFREGSFVGATDSAVPCAQLLNLATVMNKQLNSARTVGIPVLLCFHCISKDENCIEFCAALFQSNVSLMLIFFDGEEAFEHWGPNDSIYGAKNLAKKWHNTKKTYGAENDISDLDRLVTFLSKQ